MGKQKVTYLGTAPGQAGSVLIGGHRFERGEVYELDAELAGRLLAAGGFAVVKPPKSKKSLDIVEVTEE